MLENGRKSLENCFVFQIPEQYGPVRMLSQGKGSMILVGTTHNFILQGTLDLKFSPIVQVLTFVIIFAIH